MTRLEFTTLDNQAEVETVIKALLNGSEYKKAYTDKDGQQAFKLICKNKKMFVGANYSISVSKSGEGKFYIGIDYFSSDDRIAINKNKN